MVLYVGKAVLDVDVIVLDVGVAVLDVGVAVLRRCGYGSTVSIDTCDTYNFQTEDPLVCSSQLHSHTATSHSDGVVCTRVQ